MRDQVHVWLRGIWAAIISGGANTVLSTLGIAAADAVGMNVPRLDFKQVGVLFLSGAAIGLLAYLKQSPLPPEV